MNKEKILGSAILIFGLLIATGIYTSQTKSLHLLNIRKETEIKKIEVLNAIQESEKKIESYKKLLTEKDPVLITNKINNMARESNLRIISVQPGAQEEEPLYIKYPFILTMQSDSYHAIGKFISKIENYSDLYFVETISIRSQEKSQAADKKLTRQPTAKLIVNLIFSIIAFKG